nr:MAG TPA: hypothetical protein [Caudoviricetes sp.]
MNQNSKKSRDSKSIKIGNLEIINLNKKALATNRTLKICVIYTTYSNQVKYITQL